MVILTMNIKKHRRRYVACTLTKLNLYQNYFSRFLVVTKSYLLKNVTMPRSFLNGPLKKKKLEKSGIRITKSLKSNPFPTKPPYLFTCYYRRKRKFKTTKRYQVKENKTKVLRSLLT